MTDNLALIKDYQIKGSNFIVEHGGRALLADEPGAGKTVQALHAVMRMDTFPVLIFVINPGLFVWQDELEFWYDKPSVVYTGNKEERNKEYHNFIHSDCKFLIANYFFIEELTSIFPLGYWKTLIMDEYHIMGLSNHRTDRYKNIFPSVKKAESVIPLTGSPMRRNLADLFAPFKMIAPEKHSSYWRYVKTHCLVTEDHFGKTIEAMPKHPKEFDDYRKQYMIRRMKKDIMPELPPKTRQVIPVYMTPEQKKLYDMMDKTLMIDYKGKLIIAQNRAVRFLRLRQLLITPQILGFDIIGAGLEMAKALIEVEFSNGNPVALFTAFKVNCIQPIIKYLRKCLPNTVFFYLHGGMPPRKAKENYKGFQDAQTHRKVFVGVIKSGMSITLTAAKVSIFLGPELTSEENSQAEDRLHRQGATGNIRCLYILYRDDPVDDRIKEILNTKQHNIDWGLNTSDFI